MKEYTGAASLAISQLTVVQYNLYYTKADTYALQAVKAMAST